VCGLFSPIAGRRGEEIFKRLRSCFFFATPPPPQAGALVAPGRRVWCGGVGRLVSQAHISIRFQTFSDDKTLFFVLTGFENLWISTRHYHQYSCFPYELCCVPVLAGKSIGVLRFLIALLLFTPSFCPFVLPCFCVLVFPF